LYNDVGTGVDLETEISHKGDIEVVGEDLISDDEVDVGLSTLRDIRLKCESQSRGRDIESGSFPVLELD
jgi:hypothetical protein